MSAARMKCWNASCYVSALPGEVWCHAHLVEHERQVADGRERIARAIADKGPMQELERIEEGYRDR